MNSLPERITDFFVDRKIVEREMKEIYSYGLELILNDIINFSVIFRC